MKIWKVNLYSCNINKLNLHNFSILFFTQIEAIDLVDTPLANDDRNALYTELVVQSSEQSWNGCHILFGSFHQNDKRFSEHSRGFSVQVIHCICFHTQLVLK